MKQLVMLNSDQVIVPVMSGAFKRFYEDENEGFDCFFETLDDVYLTEDF